MVDFTPERQTRSTRSWNDLFPVPPFGAESLFYILATMLPLKMQNIEQAKSLFLLYLNILVLYVRYVTTKYSYSHARKIFVFLLCAGVRTREKTIPYIYMFYFYIEHVEQGGFFTVSRFVSTTLLFNL